MQNDPYEEKLKKHKERMCNILAWFCWGLFAICVYYALALFLVFLFSL